jgi:hypothetical protein
VKHPVCIYILQMYLGYAYGKLEGCGLYTHCLSNILLSYVNVQQSKGCSQTYSLPEPHRVFVMSLETHTCGNVDRPLKVESWQLSVTTGVTTQ